MNGKATAAVVLLAVAAVLLTATAVYFDDTGDERITGSDLGTDLGDASDGFNKKEWFYLDVDYFDGYKLRIGFYDPDGDEKPDENPVHLLSISNISTIRYAEVIDLDELEEWSVVGNRFDITKIGDGVNPIQTNLYVPPLELRSENVDEIMDNAISVPGDNSLMRDQTTFWLPNLKYVGNNNFGGGSSDADRHHMPKLLYAGVNSFSGCTLTCNSFPDLVRTGEGAFKGCTIRGDLEFKNLDWVDSWTFADCKLDGDIILPKMNDTWDQKETFSGVEAKNVILPSAYEFGPIYDGLKAERMEMASAKVLDYSTADVGLLIMPSVEQVKATGCKVKDYELTNITSLDSGAFKDCQGHTLNIESVTHIGDGCFSGSEFYTILAENLESVGSDSFVNAQLGLLRVPKLTDIPAYAFSDGTVDQLEMYGVTEITPYSFANCSVNKLLSDTVVEIQEYAFYNSYVRFDLPMLKTIGAHAIESGSFDITAVRLESVGDYAFHGCHTYHNLLSLPSLERVGDHAFENMARWAAGGEYEFSLNAPSLTYIGDYAFAASKLRLIDSFCNDDAELHIGIFAFDGCGNLEIANMVFGDSEIGRFAFAGTNITSVESAGDVVLGCSAFENCGLIKASFGKCDTIPVRAFANNPLVKFQAQTSAIESEAFMDCTNLSVAEISVSGPMAVGDRAFKNVPLTSFPFSSVLSIGDESFDGCSIPELRSDILEDIGTRAFGDNRFTAIELTSLRNVADGIFSGYGLTDDVMKLDRLVSVGKDTFAGNALETAVCPDLESVGERAFSGNSLKVLFAPRLEVVPAEAFAGNPIAEIDITSAESVGVSAFVGAQFTELLCPDLLTVGDSAFKDVPLDLLKIPSVTSVGDSAFSGCVLSAEVPSFHDLTTVGASAFARTGLEGFWLRSAEIGDSAFSGCLSLEQCELTYSHLGTGVFEGCLNLDRLKVSGEVTIDQAAAGETPTYVYDPEGACHTSGLPVGNYRFFAEQNAFVDREFYVYSDGNRLGTPGDKIDHSVMKYPWHEFYGWTVKEGIYETQKMLEEVPLLIENDRALSDLPYPSNYRTHLTYSMFNGKVVLQYSGHEFDEQIPSMVYSGESKMPIQKTDYSLYTNDMEFTKGVCLDNIETIAVGAFSNCGWDGPVHFENLGDVVLIDNHAFCQSKDITEFTAGDLNRVGISEGRYNVKSGVLFETEYWYSEPFHTLKCYPLGSPNTEYVVPDGCKRIEEWAFWGAQNLESLVLTSGVEEVAYRAFYDMPNIKEIIIADTVTDICGGAFGKIVFYDGDREMDESELAGHRFVGDCKAMYVMDDDTDLMKVELNLNGKTASPAYDMYAMVDGTGKVSIPEEAPTAEGYTFLGWYTDPEGGDLVRDGDHINCRVLYAHWEAIVYNITYHNLQGADNTANPDTFTIEDEFRLASPVGGGGKFLGWMGLVQEIPVIELTLRLGTTGDQAYTACWEAYEVAVVLGDTVTPVVFDGEVTMDGQRRITLPETDPSAEGYVFKGWYTQYEGGEKLSDGDVLEGNIIYAQWEAIVYNITYSGVDGAVNLNPDTYTVEDRFYLERPLMKGYSFQGWTGTGLSEPSEVVCIGIGDTGDRHYEAHMEVIQYIIVYTHLMDANNSANPIRYTVNDSFVIVDPQLNGWEFIGWTGSGITEPTKNIHFDEGTTGNKHFGACWLPETYLITYGGVEDAVNDNPNSYTALDLPLTLNQPVREGYIFEGWDDGNTVSKDVTIPDGTHRDLNFDAVWTQTTHKLTVNAGDGKLELNGEGVSSPYVSEYPHGTEVKAKGALLTVGGDVFRASHPDHDTVEWSVQDNLDAIDHDMSVTALYSDSEDKIAGVSIKTMPDKTEYLLGERFDPSGMSLLVKHVSGHTDVVTSGYTCNPTVFNDLETDHVDVTYSGFTTSCPVKVNDGPDRLFVSVPPDNTVYTYGDWFDPTGMVVSLEYLSGKTDTVTGYTWSPEVFDRIGTIDVEILYDGLVAYQEVTVNPETDPEPDDTDRFVRIILDENGLVTDDAAQAAIMDIEAAVDANPGITIIVDAISPLHEGVTIPDSIMDSVREHDATLIMTVKYGSVLIKDEALSTDMKDGSAGVTITKVEDSGLPDSFISGGRVYEVTVESDGEPRSQFSGPVGVSLKYRVGSDVDSETVRVYHLEGQEITAIEENQSRFGRVVMFQTYEFSQFAVKIAGEEYSVTAETDGHGTVSVHPERAEQYVTVRVDIAADPGYRVASVTAGGVEVTHLDGVYSFQMPASDVVVNVAFEEEAEPVPVPEEGGSEGQWYVWALAAIAVVLVALGVFYLVRRK